MVIVGTSRLTHPTTSCSRHADRPGAVRLALLLSIAGAVVLPVPVPARRRLRRGAEDVVPERTGLQRRTASGEAERSWEGPASFRCAQALRGGVHGGTPPGEPPPRVRDQGPGPDDDSQQFIGRSPLPAPHTGVPLTRAVLMSRTSVLGRGSAKVGLRGRKVERLDGDLHNLIRRAQTIQVQACKRCLSGVVGRFWDRLQPVRGVRNHQFSRRFLLEGVLEWWGVKMPE
jgi:hypothetical protein